MSRSRCLVLLATLTSCGGKEAPQAALPAEPLAVTLAEVGLEASSLDTTADPCVDFYQFACGGWMASNEIPADRARWSRFAEITEQNEDALRQILEEARAGGGDDPVMTKLGAFYGSCMDQEAIERDGLSGLAELRASIDAVRDGKTLASALTALHNAGVGAVFGAQAIPDFQDSTQQVLFVDSSGLGLPDRDYYLAEDFQDEREAYRQHLVRLFTLLGKTKKGEAEAAARNTLDIETRLAEVTRTAVEKRDLAAMYNPHDLAGLAALTPHFDWKAYLEARGNGEQARIIVTHPAFFGRFDQLIGEIQAPRWRDYLLARLVDNYAFALPEAYESEAFALEKVLEGTEEQPERARRCVDATGAALQDLLAKPYVDRMFPGESKQAAQQTVAAIVAAFDSNLSSLDWMSEPTRTAARGKLGKLEALVGYPEKPETYDFEVAPDHFTANMVASIRFQTKRQFLKAGTPVDRTEFHMPAYIVNAGYNPLANQTTLPAGILMPPFFGKDRSVAANAGGLGMVIGHELTHGFDDQGAQFDADGNMKMWWEQADYESFVARGQCVADQYSTFEALPGKFVDGKLTLGENIADLGGIELAFRAYRTLRASAPQKTVADGYTEDQQFFIGLGQAWCAESREAVAEQLLATDPHSPPRWRVNGSLRNLPEFAEAFSCPADAPMRPAETCQVW